MHWFFFILFMIWTLALIWNGKDLFNKKTMAPGGVDVHSGASGYSRHWLYVEMACSVNVIIFRRNGQTLFDHLIHVFSVRLGIKGHSSPAVHVIFRDYGGAQKIQRRKL